MALLPYPLRPRVIIRRKALRQGILGASLTWKVVAVFVYGGGPLKKIFGRSTEIISSETLRPAQFLSVLTAVPLTRREQKRTGVNRRVLEKQALADVAAAKGVEPSS